MHTITTASNSTIHQASFMNLGGLFIVRSGFGSEELAGSWTCSVAMKGSSREYSAACVTDDRAFAETSPLLTEGMHATSRQSKPSRRISRPIHERMDLAYPSFLHSNGPSFGISRSVLSLSGICRAIPNWASVSSHASPAQAGASPECDYHSQKVVGRESLPERTVFTRRAARSGISCLFRRPTDEF